MERRQLPATCLSCGLAWESSTHEWRKRINTTDTQTGVRRVTAYLCAKGAADAGGGVTSTCFADFQGFQKLNAMTTTMRAATTPMAMRVGPRFA